ALPGGRVRGGPAGLRIHRPAGRARRHALLPDRAAAWPVSGRPMPLLGQRVVFPARGAIAIEPFELADPGPHQLLVRTLCTAVSAGTELTTLLGEGPHARFPAYPGYSHVGEVVAAGRAVEGLRPGDRVLSMGH